MKRFLLVISTIWLLSGSALADAFVYANGTYKAVPVPTVNGISITSSGTVIGNDLQHAIVYDGTNTTSFDYPGATATFVEGVSANGLMTGSYYIGSALHGFTSNGTTFASFDYPGAEGLTVPRGVNSSGDVVGSYLDASLGYQQRGFYYDGNAFSALLIPGGPPWTEVYPTAINDTGEIVGFYNTGQGIVSFAYFDNNFVPISFPKSSGTQAYGINNASEIVGLYYDAQGKHGFLYDGQTFTSIDFPGAWQTEARGINDRGEVVGISAPFPPPPPVPEPSSILLLAVGIVGVRAFGIRPRVGMSDFTRCPRSVRLSIFTSTLQL